MMVYPALACAVVATGTFARGAFSPNSRLFGPVIGRGAPDSRSIYLTFDDGPNPDATPSILATLADCGVPATFFMVGSHVDRHPSIAREVAAAGHEVGNHTQHHRKLHWSGPKGVRVEMLAAHTRILEATGRPPRLFRAPHGYRSPFVGSEARRLGYSVVGWTLGVWDTARPGVDEIRRRVRRHLQGGTILLLHDGDGADPSGDRRQTAAALPGIIEDAREAGLEFRPLAELIAR